MCVCVVLFSVLARWLQNLHSSSAHTTLAKRTRSSLESTRPMFVCLCVCLVCVMQLEHTHKLSWRARVGRRQQQQQQLASIEARERSNWTPSISHSTHCRLLHFSLNSNSAIVQRCACYFPLCVCVWRCWCLSIYMQIHTQTARRKPTIDEQQPREKDDDWCTWANETNIESVCARNRVCAIANKKQTSLFAWTSLHNTHTQVGIWRLLMGARSQCKTRFFALFHNSLSLSLSLTNFQSFR